MGYKDIQTLDFRQEKCANPFEILEMDFIKLETTDVCLIDKNIRQIESTTEKLFILTGGESKLMAFDMSGKFLEQIGRIGAGPGEYILATSFSIDQHRNLISVMDAAQSKIVSYNLSNYEFVSQKPTPGRICFEYYGKDRIVWQNVDVNNELKNWNFTVTDLEMKHEENHVEKDFITGYHTAPLKCIYKHDDKLIAYTEYNPLIYCFDADSVYPQYRLNFGKYKLPPLDYLQRISAGNVNFLSELNASDYVYSFSVFEAGETFCVSYSVSQVGYIGIYNRRNNQTYNYSFEDFQKQLKIGRIEKLSGVVGDYIIIAIQPFDLLQQSEDYKLQDKLQNIVDQSNNDDNPILMMFKLKYKP